MRGWASGDLVFNFVLDGDWVSERRVPVAAARRCNDCRGRLMLLL
jgi:hypothetical protein